MGKEMLTCEYKLCDIKAEFQHEGFVYCRFHWVIESFRILVCQTCDNPTSESYQAISNNHSETCRLWNQGVDCMCLETVDVCRCEENARIVDELQSSIDEWNARVKWAFQTVEQYKNIKQIVLSKKTLDVNDNEGK